MMRNSSDEDWSGLGRARQRRKVRRILEIGSRPHRGEWIARLCLLGLGAVLAACGGQAGAPEESAPSDRWDATATWPEQAGLRVRHAKAAIENFDRRRLEDTGASMEQVHAALVDGLRGAAVAGVAGGALLDDADADPWRARLLRRSARSVGVANSVRALEGELNSIMESREPGGLVREAAVRATLAYAMFLEAATDAVDPDDYKARLVAASEVVEGFCQVPEALLNFAAIELELASIEERRSVRDVEAISEHVRRADAALCSLDLDDATTCGETRGAFFGLEGRGGRLAYLLDKSGSMDVPGGFDDLLVRIVRAIDGLPPETSFSIMFFANPPAPAGAGAETNFTEMSVPPALDDGRGMFRRGLLGDRGTGGGMDRLVEELEAVVADGTTEPVEALGRALALEASTIYLLTDGMIETSIERLAEVTRRANSQGTVINSILFYRPDEASLWQVEDDRKEGIRRLWKLARETGGSVVMATQSTGMGSSSAEADGAERALALRESLRERMDRRGYWTPEAERQYHALRAEIELRMGRLLQALEEIDSALRAPLDEADVVTMDDPSGAAAIDWPRFADALPMPADAALILEGALLASLSDRPQVAAERFDAAARVSAHCMRTADAKGHRDDASDFAELGCRSLLLGALARGLTGGSIEIEGESMDSRDANVALHAHRRAVELGIDRTGGWSRMLLAAACGTLSNLKAGVQLGLAGGPPAMAAELALVRSHFRQDGAPPSDEAFAELPLVERLFMTRVADSARLKEAP